jgi:hypothetical protein
MSPIVRMTTGGRLLPNATDKLLEEHASDCITYNGRAADQETLTSQPLWQISRTIYADGVYTTQFANNADFSAVWDDRASLFDPPGTCVTPPYQTVYVAGSVSIQSVVTQTIVNISMPTSGTEYSYLLPSGTKRFTLNLSSGREFKYSNVPGGPYVSRQVFEVNDIQGVVSRTVYFKCNGNSEVMECDSWV